MLEIKSITKTFNPGTPNEVRALQGVDLTIDEGSFVIVIGTNGSGKSTLLNAVAGTFLVDTGTVHLEGNEITRGLNIVTLPSLGGSSRIPSAARLHTCRSPRIWCSLPSAGTAVGWGGRYTPISPARCENVYAAWAWGWRIGWTTLLGVYREDRDKR